jgi:hypothetical protein
MAQMMSNDAAEWGRELKASELQIKTVVILSRDGLRGVTAWVTNTSGVFAHFTMGEIKTTLALMKVAEHDTLIDDTLEPVRVFEYKGEI